MANRSSLVCQRLTHYLRACHHESRDKFSLHLTIGQGHLRELESLIRCIEQPVYKRRWDKHWKVGNRCQSGLPAYDAEFIEAFDWWLSEKAEWWLEKKKTGGPVALDDWTTALLKDSRVAAAWPIPVPPMPMCD